MKKLAYCLLILLLTALSEADFADAQTRPQQQAVSTDSVVAKSAVDEQKGDFTFEIQDSGSVSGPGFSLCVHANGDVDKAECGNSNQLTATHDARLAPAVIEKLRQRIDAFNFIDLANSGKVCRYPFIDGPQLNLTFAKGGKTYHLTDGFGSGDSTCGKALQSFEDDVANILNIGYLLAGEAASGIAPDGSRYTAFVDIQSCRPLYPRQAIPDGLSGTVHIRLEASSNGRSIKVTLLESSGHKTLDDTVLNAMKRCQVLHKQPLGVAVHLPFDTEFKFATP